MLKLDLNSTNGTTKNPSPIRGNLKTTIWFAVCAAILTFTISTNAATHTWTGATGDGKWSTGGNWSGGAPAAGEAASVTLVFPASGSKNTSNDIPNLTLDQVQISGDNYVIGATGAGTNVTLRSQVISSTFFISGANALVTNFNFNISTASAANASITVATGETATFRSRFVGAGGLNKVANGKLILDGNLPNTYGGVTTVQGGDLDLSHSSNAIPGDLVIGYPAIANLATVTLLFQNQIADNANILVNWNGTFSPSVFTETISSITLSNANFVAGIGLTLKGTFTSVGTNTTTGVIRLGGASRTFDVTGFLTMDAFIENTNATAAGLSKSGSGTMELKRPNTFNGTTTVSAGKLIVNHTTSLGLTNAGTIVESGATMELAAGITNNGEVLNLAGVGVNSNGVFVLRNLSAWNGPVSFGLAAVHVPTGELAALNGQLEGDFLYKIGSGTLRLGGSSDNFIESVYVRKGLLQLAKQPGLEAVSFELHIGEDVDLNDDARVQLLAAEQVRNNGFVSVNPSGRFDLNGFSETIAATYLKRGSITTGAGILKLGGEVNVHSVPLSYSDTYSFISGNVALNATERLFQLYSSPNAIAALNINGSISDGTTPSGVKLDGNGRVTFMTGPNTYSGTTKVSGNVSLELAYGALPGNTTGGTVVENGANLSLNSSLVGLEALTLHGAATNIFAAFTYTETNVWAGPININGDCLFYGYENDRLTLSGAISGTGTFTKRGGGMLQLSGAGDNTFSGGLAVDHGEIELNKTGGASAVPGALNIGFSDSFATFVRLLANNQIANGSVISIWRKSELNLNGFNDTVGSLVLKGGDVTTSNGTLTLLSDITGARLYQSSGNISGKLSLAGVQHNVFVTTNSSINFYAQVSDPGTAGTIKFAGHGLVYLQGSNTYSGITIVDDMYLVVSKSNSLGAVSGGTVLTNGARLALGYGISFSPEPLVVHDGYIESSSTNRWNGPIFIPGALRNYRHDNALVYLSGPISGTGSFYLVGNNVIDGNEPNTFSGLVEVSEGTLTLAKSDGNAIAGPLNVGELYSNIETNGTVRLANHHQISDLSAVTVQKSYWTGAPGVFDLNGFQDTIGWLTGDSEIRCGTGTLTIAGNGGATEFTGYISGSGGTNIVKNGTSQLVLNGTNSFSGKTIVNNGTLYLVGTQTNSSVIVNGGTFGGGGAIGNLTVNSGGTVSPGYGPGSCAHLQAGSVAFNPGSKYAANLGNILQSTNYDRIICTGLFIINNATLELNQVHQSAVSNQFAIIDSGAASMGHFSNLPSGTAFSLKPGQNLSISYNGGLDSNDVVLTQLSVPAPSTVGGIVRLPDGNFQISGAGTAGFYYYILANTNLSTTNWVGIGAVQANQNGEIQFTDTAATNFPIRFYRLLSL